MASQPELTIDGGQWQSDWQQHASWVRTVIAARVESVWVDEVLQNVAVQAWRCQSQLSHREKMGPWLYRIAIQQVQLFFRKSSQQRQRFPNVETVESVDDQQIDPLEYVTRCEVHQQIRDVLKTMSVEDREILLLKHTEGWTYQQLADRLGLSIDQVVYRLSKAKQNLRCRLHFLEADES